MIFNKWVLYRGVFPKVVSPIGMFPFIGFQSEKKYSVVARQ